jgi:hypothetical protein
MDRHALHPISCHAARSDAEGELVSSTSDEHLFWLFVNVKDPCSLVEIHNV